MLSIDASSKRVAYNTFLAMTKSITAQGFVPNGAAASWRSWDRTEPPIGAKILLEMFTRWRDVWLVEAAIDELLTWNGTSSVEPTLTTNITPTSIRALPPTTTSDWFYARRRLQPLGLICLGSDLNPGADADPLAGTHIGATLESGLDNSPMYWCVWCEKPPPLLASFHP